MIPLIRVLGATMLSVGATAVAALGVARWLGPYGQGQFTTGVLVASMCALLAGANTSSSVRVFLAEHHDSDIVRSYMGLSMLQGLLAIVMCAGFSTLTFHVAPDLAPGDAWLLWLPALSVAMLAVRQSADLLMVADSLPLGIAIQALVGVTTLLGAFVFHRAGVLSPGVAIALTTLANGVTFLVVSALLARFSWVRNGTFSRRAAMQLASSGSRSTGFTVGQLIIGRADRLVLGLIARPEAVGLYSIAASLSEMTRALPQSMGQWALQESAVHSEIRRQRILRVQRSAALLLLATGVLIALCAAPIVEVLLGQAYAGAVPALRVLAFGEIWMGLAVIDGRILLALRRETVLGLIGIGTAVLSIPIYVLGAAGWQAVGVAFGSVLVYALLEVLLRLEIRRTLSRDSVAGDPGSVAGVGVNPDGVR